MTIPLNYDRVARLEELRLDGSGWGWIDVGKLLEEWGFRPESLGVSFGVEQFLYVHEQNPKYYLRLWARHNLSLETVQYVVRKIDDVRLEGV